MKTSPFLTLGLLAALLQAAPLHAAPPANDAFANRINLGSAATVATTGTNVEATLQPGEDDFGGFSGASVWYEWTAPTTGWVTVHTVPSALDTVLGIFTGSSLGSLTRLGFTDGTPFDSEYASGHPSRIYFLAQAGTSYKIAVHGWVNDTETDEGPFSLQVAYETPPSRVTSVTLTPDPVNITTSAQTVTITVGLEFDTPLQPGEFAASIRLFAPGASIYDDSVLATWSSIRTEFPETPPLAPIRPPSTFPAICRQAVGQSRFNREALRTMPFTRIGDGETISLKTP